MSWMEDLLARTAAAPGSVAGAAGRVAWYERQRGWGTDLSVLLNLDDDGLQYTHDGPSSLSRPEIVVEIFGPNGSAVEAEALAIRNMFETDSETVGGSIFGMGFVRAGRTVGPDDMPDGARVFRRRMIVTLSVEAA